MPRSRTKTAGRKTKAGKTASNSRKTAARTTAQRKTPSTFVCSECGKTFTRAASLGAHRNRAHGIAGKSTNARSRRASGTPQRTAAASRGRTNGRTPTAPPERSVNSDRVNRDALLKSLFPNGIPAREQVIREVNAWLDQAERLAALT